MPRHLMFLNRLIQPEQSDSTSETPRFPPSMADNGEENEDDRSTQKTTTMIRMRTKKTNLNDLTTSFNTSQN